MINQHRATDSKWAFIKARAVLEVAQPAEFNHLEKPDSSLLSQVAAVIENGTACDRSPERVARAAIREVAAWLREQGRYSDEICSQRLEQEAER